MLSDDIYFGGNRIRYVAVSSWQCTYNSPYTRFFVDVSTPNSFRAHRHQLSSCLPQTQISMAVAITIWLLALSLPGEWCCPESSLEDSGSDRTLRLSGAGRRQAVPGGVEGSGCLWEERKVEEEEEEVMQLPGHTPELDLSLLLARQDARRRSSLTSSYLTKQKTSFTPHRFSGSADSSLWNIRRASSVKRLHWDG